MTTAAAHSKLEIATQRLNQAFQSLETSVAAIPARTSSAGFSQSDLDAYAADLNDRWEKHCNMLESDLQTSQSEAEALRQENIRLSNQLQELQQDYLELQQIADHVANTLDKKAMQLELIR